MKKYKLKFSVELIEGDDSLYSPKKVIDVGIKENLPKDVDAERYLRKRLAEEVSRNFAALDEPIDNISDEIKSNEDALSPPY